MDDRTTRIPDTTQLVACPPRRQAKPADPCAMVIFGATGDLTKRLVVPALYNLLRTKVLPDQFALIGVARTEETAESWREQLYGMLKSFVGSAAAEFDIDEIDEAAWTRLAQKMVYVQGDLTQPDLYDKLRGVLDEAEQTYGTRGNAIFYLAIAARLFGTVVEQLGKAKLTDQHGDRAGIAVGFGASLSTTIAGYVAHMFGAAVVFLFLGSVGAFGLLLVLALMPETREAPAATYFRAAGQD